jgi:hypothetical protein
LIRDTAAVRRIAGLAALAYVAGVGIENMEVLDSPTLGSPIVDIRSAYDDQAFGVVTHTAGALALVFYVVFGFALFLLVRAEGARLGWPLVGLLGGVVGPTLAGIGLTTSAALVVDAGGFSDDTVRTLFDLYLIARMVAGPFMALFLVGMGTAGLRTGVLPAWLVGFGYAIAALLAFTPLAAITEAQALEIGVGLAFAIDTLWIFGAGLLLALGEDLPGAVLVRRAAFLVLVIAAGLVGLGLLAVPAATETFFAWGLGPEPLAAFAGGVYVGAAVLYGIALPQTWRRVHGLVAGGAVLAVSVLAATLTHTDQFDFDRLQAWAWVVLFVLFSLVMLSLLVIGGDELDRAPCVALPAWIRGLFATIALLGGALAIALWIDPTGLSGSSPFELPPLGGRFAGCWIALLATLAGWAAVRNDAEQARLPALGLVLLPAGALVAALRTIGDLEPAEAAASYVALLGALSLSGAFILRAMRN